MANDLTPVFPSPQAARDAVEKTFADIPQTPPAVTEVLIGRDSTIWLKTGDGENGWTVLDSAGQPLARVTLPVGARPVHADRSQVWVVSLDSMDVPSAVRFRVSPMSTGR
jgi:hypothetical protein